MANSRGEEGHEKFRSGARNNEKIRIGLSTGGSGVGRAERVEVDRAVTP